jgi:aspartyl protease family protein
MKKHSVWLCLIFGLLSLSVKSAESIEVVGLFSGTALLKIDGQQRLLKVGQAYSGVLLISADSRGAVVENNGQQQELKLSRTISNTYTVREKTQVTIPLNLNREYITSATINGIEIPVLVDTGANVVAMNSHQARRLNIDYKKGEPARVKTASGEEPAFRVFLNSVEVGGIRINHVQASVLEGEFPQEVLLGMSFLQHVKIEENEGLMHLIQKH